MLRAVLGESHIKTGRAVEFLCEAFDRCLARSRLRDSRTERTLASRYGGTGKASSWAIQTDLCRSPVGTTEFPCLTFVPVRFVRASKSLGILNRGKDATGTL